MSEQKNEWNKRNKKNTTRLGYFTFAWVASMALASFGPKFLWHQDTLITLLSIFLNLGFGIGMIWANMRQLNGLDELQKKIQLEAMGIALGVGVVGGLSYSLFDVTNMITKAEIPHLVILIALTYLAATFIGKMRYK